MTATPNPAITKDSPSSTLAREYVTIMLDGQQFGIPTGEVYDILEGQRLTPVALAASEVSGVMNIRGRIVTAIDARRRLGMPDREPSARTMNVVVHHKGESYALVVDTVGEVRAMEPSDYQKNPANMAQDWARLSAGVYRLAQGLLVVLDVERLIGETGMPKAA